MTTPDATDRDFRRYLLDRLSEAKRDAVEMRLLTDDDAYHAMLTAEDDLLDAYVGGELNGRDRRAFERHVLPRSGTAERLAFTRELRDYAEQTAVQETPAHRSRSGGAGRLTAWLGTLLPAPAPALRLATAGLALVLVVASGWFAWRTTELSRQVAELKSAQSELAGERQALAASRDRLADELAAARAAAADREATTDELASARNRVEELETALAAARRSRQQPRREPVAASFLLALATRSAGTPELSVPAAADVVRLQLDTAGDDAYYDAFRVRLLGPDGSQVWSRTGLAADATTGTVDVELAAELLPTGRYEVLLDGVGNGGETELVGAYEFQLNSSR